MNELEEKLWKIVRKLDEHDDQVEAIRGPRSNDGDAVREAIFNMQSLEASANLFHDCLNRARDIFLKDHPAFEGWPDGSKAFIHWVSTLESTADPEEATRFEDMVIQSDQEWDLWNMAFLTAMNTHGSFRAFLRRVRDGTAMDWWRTTWREGLESGAIQPIGSLPETPVATDGTEKHQ